MEKGESINNKDSKPKRKWEDYQRNPKSYWDKYEQETMYKRGYARKEGKLTKFLEEFKPYYTEIRPGIILNIDCARNKDEILLQWTNKITLLIATDERFHGLNKMDVRNLLI